MDSSSEVGEGKVGVTTLFVENIPGLTVKMAKDQRARRFVPEYSPNAARFRKEVSRETGLGGSSKEETADCGNQNEEGNKENGVENVLGVEIKEEGCIVASEFRVDPKPVANLNKSGKNPFAETHQTWASRLINSGVEVLDSKSERVGDEVRTQKGIQFGPENLVENMIEALDLARCGQTSKRAVIQLKTYKVSSDLGKQAWANRVNESFNAGKGFSMSDVEVA
ncbi:hypothetical protein V6N12_010437 [Hibiscus sabdariffa]|uniref:Uncharacterized protein n=1 Tax=Hibiscus sabdariffa TaxID=183260 RepID=A0ABR2ELK1_9ROSI